VKIICVGGGPAGLYFSILMKRADPGHAVTVLERKPASGPDGWGVVFWDDLVAELVATDPETARRITEAAFEWHGQTLELRGVDARIEGSGYSIVRSKLLEILAARATELGVEIQFDHEVTSRTGLEDADVVVAADGANSNLRQLSSNAFGTSIAVGHNKYLWMGTAKVFDAFTFPIVNTRAGWIWSHAYAIDDHTSTFIVECRPETWAGLGFETLTGRDGTGALEDLFGSYLDGEHLVSLSPADAVLPWLNFRTVTNECWHSGNTVLMGDAAHTTHFSIGSGTRLALQDAMALAAELQANPTPQLAFAAYETKRRAELARIQTDAQFSARWFENIDRYIDLPAQAFLHLLAARRDPFVHRVPPKLYYRLYSAVDKVSFLRSFRGWIMPKARALYRRERNSPPQ